MAAAVCLAIAAGVGYGIHTVTQERDEKRAAASVVAETTMQLRGSLKRAAPEALAKIEDNVRLAQSWRNGELADATEHYLIGAREILRRRTEADRLMQKASASRAALATHMTRAAHRGGSWISTASALKKQVERDHFDLDVQLRTLAELLDTLPEAGKRLAPHVEAALLPGEDLSSRARREVLEEARRAAAELEKVRNLAR